MDTTIPLAACQKGYVYELRSRNLERGVYEYEQSIDRLTGRPVAFDSPVASGGRGWYYTDTDEADQSIRPASRQNQPLFDYLDSLEPVVPANDRTLRVRGRLSS